MQKYILFLLVSIVIYSRDSFDVLHDNDLFITDEYYTSGFEFKYRHNSSLNNLNYYNIFFGQKIYTPSDITTGDISKFDRPYAAWLYFGYEKEMFSTESLKTYGFQLGLTGPRALGKIVQGSIHKMIGEESPDGWEDQIQEIVGIQYYCDSLKEVYIKKEGSSLISRNEHISYELGNVFTNIKYGQMFLIGNKTPYGEGENYWNYYFFFEPQIKLTLFDATLRGAIFHDKSIFVENFNKIMITPVIGYSLTHKNITFNYSLNFNSTEAAGMPWKPVNHIYSRFYLRGTFE